MYIDILEGAGECRETNPPASPTFPGHQAATAPRLNQHNKKKRFI